MRGGAFAGVLGGIDGVAERAIGLDAVDGDAATAEVGGGDPLAGAVDLDVGGAGAFGADFVEKAEAAVGLKGEGADLSVGDGDDGEEERPRGVNGEEGGVFGFGGDGEVRGGAGGRIERHAVDAFRGAGADVDGLGGEGGERCGGHEKFQEHPEVPPQFSHL